MSGLGCCVECLAPATVEHHVVPRSRGGRHTVPLCGYCHSRAHNVDARVLSAEGKARARQRRFAVPVTRGAVPRWEERERALLRASARFREALELTFDEWSWLERFWQRCRIADGLGDKRDWYASRRQDEESRAANEALVRRYRSLDLGRGWREMPRSYKVVDLNRRRTWTLGEA